jgi:hypothetical protein
MARSTILWSKQMSNKWLSMRQIKEMLAFDVFWNAAARYCVDDMHIGRDGSETAWIVLDGRNWTPSRR